MQRSISKVCAPLLLSAIAACGGVEGTGGSTASGTSTGGGATATSSATGTGGIGGTGGTGGATGSTSSTGGTGGSVVITNATRVDLVIAVDNSRSMAEKQAVLSLTVSTIVSSLVNPLCLDPNGVPAPQQPASGDVACPPGTERELVPVTDMHIGVVSSSLGGHGSDACPTTETLSCAGQPNSSNNDAGHLLTRSAPCNGATLPTYQNKGFLAWDPAMTLVPPGEGDATALASVIEDLVSGAGQVGCGFESQLESWYRFLIDPEPYATLPIINGLATPTGTDASLLQQRADFLRPDSLLAILMLSDEDDCSIKEFGQFFYAAQITNPGNPGQLFHLPRPRAECAVNPNDPCCKSCGSDPGACPPDPGCQSSPTLTALEDAVSLRCWDQKRRFGIDFLYDVSRYTGGLTKPTVPNRIGDLVPNPIFSDLDPTDNITNIRTPDLVFLLGIVGVPWQDIARDPSDLTKGYKDAAELGMSQNGLTRWDVIIGDPANYVAPKDPLMISLNKPRSGTNPVTGDAIASPANPLGNPINGNEYSIPNQDDLEYACIFPLPVPLDCTNPQNTVCACTNALNDNPLCAPNPNDSNKRTLQARAKAYPSTRQIRVLKGLGDQGIVTSICPSQQADATKADYAYVPAARALVERIKAHLQ